MSIHVSFRSTGQFTQCDTCGCDIFFAFIRDHYWRSLLPFNAEPRLSAGYPLIETYPDGWPHLGEYVYKDERMGDGSPVYKLHRCRKSDIAKFEERTDATGV